MLFCMPPDIAICMSQSSIPMSQGSGGLAKCFRRLSDLINLTSHVMPQLREAMHADDESPAPCGR